MGGGNGLAVGLGVVQSANGFMSLINQGSTTALSAEREWMEANGMCDLEHYFENLLYRGQDVSGDVNKNALTADEQNAVEVCAAYVKYTMCGGDAVLLDAILHDNVEPVRHGRWINDRWEDDVNYHTCNACGMEMIVTYFDSYCSNCGARMDVKP